MDNRPRADVLAHCRTLCRQADEYRFLGARITLYSDSRELLHRVRPFLAGFRKDAGTLGNTGSGRLPDTVFYLSHEADAERPFRVVNSTGRYAESERWEHVLAFLLGMIHAHIWFIQPNLLPLHSAAVALEGQAFLFPATSGGGKTTLALEFSRNGFAYLSDEFAPLDLESLVAGPHVLPFPRPLQASEEAVRVLMEPAQATRILRGPCIYDELGEKRYPVHPASYFVIGQATPVGHLIFPIFQPGRGPALEPLDKATALAELARASIVFQRDAAWKQQAIEALGSIVRQADCYRLILGVIGSHSSLLRKLVTRSTGERMVQARATSDEHTETLEAVLARARELLRSPSADEFLNGSLYRRQSEKG